MKTLSLKEEEIMNVLWKQGPLFMREILEFFDAPKPHFNTLSTMVRRLETSQFIAHKIFGSRNFQYYAQISKDEYEHYIQQKTIGKYLNGSYMGFISRLVKEEEISIDELKELIKKVEQQNS